MTHGYRSYDIAAGALLLLTAAAAAIVFVSGLCAARRRNDAARSWLLLYKLAFGLFLLAVVLYFFSHLLAVVYSELRHVAVRAKATRAVSDVFRAYIETSTIGSLLDEFAFIFILLVLVGLAAGIRLVNGCLESMTDRMLRAGFYVIAVLLTILNITSFALSERHFSMAYSNRDMLTDPSPVPRTAWQAFRATKHAARAVALVMLVVQLVATVAVLTRAVVVAVQARAEPKAMTAIKHLLACSMLLLLRASYAIGSHQSFRHHRKGESIMAYADASRPAPQFTITDVVLSCWPLFAIFVLLFALASREQHGLWSTEQPFMTASPGGPGMSQTPWGYDYSPQSQQPLHPHWQQPQGSDSSYGHAHELPCQQSVPAAHFAQHESDPPAHWQPAHFPHNRQPYEVGAHHPVHYQSSSPPPPHSDAMGLYHQADGTPPQMTPLPYNEK